MPTNFKEKPQYGVTVRENDKVIGAQHLLDPFIRTTIKLSGFRAAWRVLRHGLVFSVHVDGSAAASRVVFEGDYTEIKKEPVEVPQAAAPVKVEEKANG